MQSFHFNLVLLKFLFTPLFTVYFKIEQRVYRTVRLTNLFSVFALLHKVLKHYKPKFTCRLVCHSFQSAVSNSNVVMTLTAPGAGGQGPGRPKMAKSPSINNIHSKHARSIPGAPGLPNSSLIHQVSLFSFFVLV